MRSLGVSVNPSGRQPRLAGVIVSGTLDGPAMEDVFELRATDSEPAEQAVDLARLLLAKLPGLDFDAAAVRTAGTPPVARRNRAQFSRAHAEGAVIYVLRQHTGTPIVIGDPKHLATLGPLSKDDLIAKARSLSSSKQDAAIAALSALPHR